MAAKQFFLPYQAATINAIAEPGATLTFYQTGTTTKLPIYSTALLDTELANPVRSNAVGRFADVYLDSTQTYRLIISDRNGAALQDIDPFIPGSVVGMITGGDMAVAQTRTDLSQMTGTGMVWLNEDGREGHFKLDTSDMTAHVAADPDQGIYIAQELGTGAWVRQFDGPAQGSWFGISGDATDVSAKVAAAKTAVLAAGGPGILELARPDSYYRFDSQLDLESTVGLTLRGPGGRVEPVSDTAPCALVYTGTASSFIKAGKSHGLTIEGLAIQVSNASFTGDIITLDNDGAGGAVTYSTSIVNCMIGGRTSAAKTARSCINAQGAVELFVDLCTFGYADHHIISHQSAGSALFSNAVTITRNRFNQHNVHSINCFKGLQWAIQNNVFEQQYGGSGSTGVAAAISDIEIGGSTHGPTAVKITGNGFWDCNSGIWIDLYAFGQMIAGNYATLGNGATFVRFSGGAGGKLSSNYATGTAGAKFMDFAVSAVAGLDDDGSNLVDGAVTYNADPTGFTPPDRSARDMSVRSSTALAVSGTGGTFHARKAAATSGIFGGGVYFDRNDDTNWRGGGLFSYLDPSTSKECIAITVAASTTAPTDTSLIKAKLNQDGLLDASGFTVGWTQVVGARQTGWTAGTGTANKGAFATYAGHTASAAYVQAEAQSTDDATKANSQRIKAIEDALRTHGLIN
jgi:predicted transcriptional regulator